MVERTEKLDVAMDRKKWRNIVEAAKSFSFNGQYSYNKKKL